jgi:hypothetical protein
MVGAHVDDNVFKCGRFANSHPAPFLANATRTVDGVTMLACPLGAFMFGFVQVRVPFFATFNLLACQWGTGNDGWFSESVDGSDGNPTQDGYPMHVCPPGGVMAGIHVGQNKFICDRWVAG